MKTLELANELSNRYLHIRKDILMNDNNWLSVSDKNIYILSDFDINWQRKQCTDSTYKVSFKLKDFYNNIHEINLYKEFNEMDFINECREYLFKELFVFIDI